MPHKGKNKIKSPFPKEVYKKNAEIYKVLSNPVRLEIMNIIRAREVTVDEISQVIGVSATNISQHLAVLRHMKLVSMHKEGTSVRYMLVDSRIVEPCVILRQTWE